MAATGTRARPACPWTSTAPRTAANHVEADLPGAGPDSVEVTVEHGTLTIQAERSPHYGDSEQVIVAERPQGSLTLGEGVDSENLTASYADGPARDHPRLTQGPGPPGRDHPRRRRQPHHLGQRRRAG
jgi:HSP20 family protein